MWHQIYEYKDTKKLCCRCDITLRQLDFSSAIAVLFSPIPCCKWCCVFRSEHKFHIRLMVLFSIKYKNTGSNLAQYWYTTTSYPFLCCLVNNKFSIGLLHKIKLFRKIIKTKQYTNISVMPLPRRDTYHHSPWKIERKYANPHCQQTVQGFDTEHAFRASHLYKVAWSLVFVDHRPHDKWRKDQIIDIFWYEVRK
jgi:hypothetical protein